MRSSQWQLQDAKTQFSQVVDAALRGEPQHITRNGKRAVVVLSEQEFKSLRHSAQAAAPGFIAHLLAIPREKMPGTRWTLNEPLWRCAMWIFHDPAGYDGSFRTAQTSSITSSGPLACGFPGQRFFSERSKYRRNRTRHRKEA